MTAAGGRGGGGKDRDRSSHVTAPAELSYAEATAELDAIIAEFDDGQVDVDRLAERFQRATELVEELDKRIRVNRQKVESLAPRLDAIAGGPPSARAPAAQAPDRDGEGEGGGEPSLL